MTHPTVDGQEFELALPYQTNSHIFNRLQSFSDTYKAAAEDYATQGIYSYTVNGLTSMELNQLITAHAPEIGQWGDPFMGGKSSEGLGPSEVLWPKGQDPDKDGSWFIYLLAYGWALAQGQMYGIMCAIQLSHYQLGNTGRPKGT